MITEYVARGYSGGAHFGDIEPRLTLIDDAQNVTPLDGLRGYTIHIVACRHESLYLARGMQWCGQCSTAIEWVRPC